MSTSESKSKSPLVAAVAAAVAASVCCLGPVVLLALGISGAWIGSLSALEPVRPLFVLLTGGFLGYAYARIFGDGAAAEACDANGVCARPGYRTFQRVAFWAVTAVVAGLLMLPAYLGAKATEAPAAPPPAPAAAPVAAAAQDEAPARAEVVLAVEHMTCAGCLHTVRKALEAVPGVESASVTLDPPRAKVVYDPRRVAVDDLVAATTDAGYPSRPAG